MKDMSKTPNAQPTLNAGSSMAAGNTVNTKAREWAMSGPGSEPVDPLPAKEDLDDPTVQFTPVDEDPRKTITDRAGRGSTYSAPTLEWKACTNGD